MWDRRDFGLSRLFSYVGLMGAGNSKRNPALTPLRFRMIEDMRSAGLASGTQTLYLDAVFRLAGHYHRSRDQLSEAEVRAWLLGLRERGVALGTFKTNYGGIRFLYRRTLEKDWPLFGEKKDPSAEAVASANRSARQPGPGASGPRQQSRTSDMPGTPWGEGERGVLDYLARYVFRVAITNTRIVGLDDQTVTIRHKQRKSNQWLTSCIPGHEFMRRYLQHVLPKGLHKVRYSGLWHPARREQAARVRQLLLLDQPPARQQTEENRDAGKLTADHPQAGEPWICPRCKEGHLVHVRRLAPKWAQGP